MLKISFHNFSKNRQLSQILRFSRIIGVTNYKNIRQARSFETNTKCSKHNLSTHRQLTQLIRLSRIIGVANWGKIIQNKFSSRLKFSKIVDATSIITVTTSKPDNRSSQPLDKTIIILEQRPIFHNLSLRKLVILANMSENRSCKPYIN